MSRGLKIVSAIAIATCIGAAGIRIGMDVQLVNDHQTPCVNSR